MLPLRDDLPTRRTPWVNRLLLVTNILVFLWWIGLGARGQVIAFERYALVPADLFARPESELLSLVTSIFLHAGWLHLGGNMLMLWIFGNNVEDRLGHRRYLLFYLACGIVASLAQAFSAPTSTVPGIGASGAIAGVLAAYLLWFPRARVAVLIPILILPWIVRLPSLVVIGLWFALQLLQGVAALGPEVAQQGGVAWWAHIGGFLAGLVLGPLLSRD